MPSPAYPIGFGGHAVDVASIRGRGMSTWDKPLDDLRSRLANPAPILDAIARECIEGPTGALDENYYRSGLHQRSGLLYRGITSRSWGGHYCRIVGTRVTVGLDLRSISYARPV